MAFGGRNRVAEAAKDARPYRPSHLKVGAAPLRRRSRLERRLVAPGRMVSSGCSWWSTSRCDKCRRPPQKSRRDRPRWW